MNRSLNVYSDQINVIEFTNKLDSLNLCDEVIINGAAFPVRPDGPKVQTVTFVNISDSAWRKLKGRKIIREQRTAIRNFGK